MRGRVLWIDDEIDLLKPHILYLEEKGYEVEQVTNGRDAVAHVEKEAFDLVLLDEMMPGMDGIATLREIKELRPGMPVIMITKSEEEWLMNEAISEKIADYLTKPVNSSQIFLTCKKILEEEKILDEKAASTYLSDFQAIEATISSELTMDEWWELYLKLTRWQIEMDSRKDLGLGSILDEQVKSANSRFTHFFVENYLHWIHSEPDNRPPLSVDVFSQFVAPHLLNDEKVFLLVIDCLRLDHALTILLDVQPYFDAKMDYHLSILPSATPFSRNAIFSGRFPSEIQKRKPGVWESMLQSESSMNQYERDFMTEQLGRLQHDDISFDYHKVNVARAGRNFLSHIKEYEDKPFISLVVNFVDLLTHHRSQSDVLQEMLMDESGYRATVRTWFQNSWLFDLLRYLSDSSYRVIVTTDHGSIRVKKGIQLIGDKETSTGVRYKYGRNLNCSEKHALVVKRPRDYFLPEVTTGTNYIMAKEDVYFVYPTQYRKYLNLYQNSFQHGGISMEELMVPTLSLTVKA
ncbi:MAG: response regulator [Candidatus Neomarinimicrobiota bacterium]